MSSFLTPAASWLSSNAPLGVREGGGGQRGLGMFVAWGNLLQERAYLGSIFEDPCPVRVAAGAVERDQEPVCGARGGQSRRSAEVAITAATHCGSSQAT